MEDDVETRSQKYKRPTLTIFFTDWLLYDNASNAIRSKYFTKNDNGKNITGSSLQNAGRFPKIYTVHK